MGGLFLKPWTVPYVWEGEPRAWEPPCIDIYLYIRERIGFAVWSDQIQSPSGDPPTDNHTLVRVYVRTVYGSRV